MVRIVFFALVMMQSITTLAQSKPNIIFMLADDLGYGEISRNSSTYETPSIDSLAGQSMYFSNFHARPVCTPTRYALMTGKYSFRDTLDSFVIFAHDTPDSGIQRDETTLPEYLKEQGYITGGFGKWHLGNTTPDNLPYAQGFDYFWGSVWAFSSMKTFLLWGTWNRSENNTISEEACVFATDCQTEKAISWMELQAADTTAPFFLYMSYTNPHNDAYGSDTIPYKPEDLALAPAGYSTTAKQKWANIKNLDESVSQVWASVRSLGIEDNTIIVFTSDNGGDNTDAPDNGPYSYFKAQNGEGGHRVPFIWHHKNTVDSGAIDSLISIEDMLPTLVEGVAGGRVRNQIDGINFHSLMSGGSRNEEKYWFGLCLKDRMWSVQKHGWKLVNNIGTFGDSPAAVADNIELYDLITDPSESTDVSGSNPGIVTELQAVFNSETIPPSRSPTFSPPSGWVNPPFWGDPHFFYSNDYYYKLNDYKR